MWNDSIYFKVIRCNLKWRNLCGLGASCRETIHLNVKWFNALWNQSTRCEMIQCDLKLFNKIENHSIRFEMIQQLSKAFNIMWNKSTRLETIYSKAILIVSFPLGEKLFLPTFRIFQISLFEVFRIQGIRKRQLLQMENCIGYIYITWNHMYYVRNSFVLNFVKWGKLQQHLWNNINKGKIVFSICVLWRLWWRLSLVSEQVDNMNELFVRFIMNIMKQLCPVLLISINLVVLVNRASTPQMINKW